MLKDLSECDQLKKLHDGKVVVNGETKTNAKARPKHKATFKQRREQLKKK